MARQNINTGSTANDGTGDPLRTAGNKINDNFRELYLLLGGDSGNVTDKLSLADSGVVFNGVTHKTVLAQTEGSARVDINLPDSDGTITLNEGTQTLTNKTLTSPVLTTPQINDTSSDHQYVFAASELAADRTITLPLLTGNDEFVFKDHAQTLTQKTLTEPTLYAPKIQGHIDDSSGNILVDFTRAASAVNNIELSNAATNGIPQLAGKGTDSDVGLGLSGKNRGLVHIQTGMRIRGETISSTAQSIRRDRALTVFNSSSALTATLPNGTFEGETKTFVNKNSGAVTITPTLFKNGTSFTLNSKGMVSCMWLDSPEGWFLQTDKEYASGDGMLWYVTA